MYLKSKITIQKNDLPGIAVDCLLALCKDGCFYACSTTCRGACVTGCLTDCSLNCAVSSTLA